MNVAVLHYHLNQGGVSRVVANHLRSLDATGVARRVLLVTGPRREAWPADLADSLSHVDLELVVVPELEYDEGTTFEADTLTTALRSAVSNAGFDPAETVLHVHNHGLGKNLASPFALRRLAADGFGVLLHVHDFAEDFRPENYARMAAAYDGDPAATIYPDAPRVHYAVLNRRDFDVVRQAGVADERLHFLPNPVPVVEPGGTGRDSARARLRDCFGVEPDCPYLLYPVRGIRRKNVGEAVLWSAVLGDRGRVGITLSPLNPAERKPYDEWVEFARETGLSTLFGTGDDGGLSFGENVVAADRVLTTSVAEGFGLTFLEPWTYDRALVGRNLPEITADFADEGLVLDGLYDELRVPLEWIGRERFAAAFTTAARRVGEAYGRAPSPDDVEAAIATKTAHDSVDFGDLDAVLQRRVLRRIVEDAAARDWMLSSTPVFEAASRTPVHLAGNRRVVEERYSLAACGSRLESIYSAIVGSAESEVGTLANAAGVLDRFLDLGRLRLLRS